MNPLIQCNIKNITKIKVHVNHNVMPVFSAKRLISIAYPKSFLEPKYQGNINKLRTISIYQKLYSNSFRSSPDDSLLDDEDKFNSVLEFSADTTHNFKAECSKQELFLTTQLKSKNNSLDQITNHDWDVMKSEVLKMTGTISEKSIDAVIISKCCELKCLSLGKSYFKYLKSTQQLINRATYGNYLRLFFCCKSDCTSDDLNEITAVYKELLEVYPLLDSHTAEKAICALSLTSSWKEYEKLFVTIKQFYNPSFFIYKTVVETAFDNGELELGWKLMEEMQYQGLDVHEETLLYWLQKVKYRKVEEDLIRVFKFLNYFNAKPSDELCKAIKEVFEEYNKEGRGTFARIARNGECRSCHSKLEPCYVSQEDFNQLRKAFLNPVIIGKDIFQKTKPEEFLEFQSFLKKSGSFDVVLDGLNIAYHGSKKNVSDCTFRLKAVVKHFVSQNKNVLVLGRKHMAKWQTPNMDYVIKNAHLFLADNLSQDDPFMLYSAMYSGPGCCFVSRDMMRGHKFLLSDPKLQITFQKWQFQNQYFIISIDRHERVYFQEPVSFLQSIQQNSKGDWHIPFIVKGEELSNRDRVDHLHRHWLCLQKKSSLATYRQKERSNQYSNTRPVKTLERGSAVKKSTGIINLKEILRDCD